MEALACTHFNIVSRQAALHTWYVLKNICLQMGFASSGGVTSYCYLQMGDMFIMYISGMHSVWSARQRHLLDVAFTNHPDQRSLCWIFVVESVHTETTVETAIGIGLSKDRGSCCASNYLSTRNFATRPGCASRNPVDGKSCAAWSMVLRLCTKAIFSRMRATWRRTEWIASRSMSSTLMAVVPLLYLSCSVVLDSCFPV